MNLVNIFNSVIQFAYSFVKSKCLEGNFVHFRQINGGNEWKRFVFLPIVYGWYTTDKQGIKIQREAIRLRANFLNFNDLVESRCYC